MDQCDQEKHRGLPIAGFAGGALLLCLFFGTLASLHAARLSVALDDLRFDWFEESEDFASIAVVALHQDRLGFIWVGTRDGIYRYDGERFVEYGSSGAERARLPYNEVQAFFEDSKGNLWAGLGRAVVRYDYGLERFVEYPVEGYLLRTVGFVEQADGNLLLVDQNGGFYSLDEQGSFKPISSRRDDWARCLVSTGEGDILVAGRDGVRAYSKRFEEIRFYDAKAILVDSLNSFITAMALGEDGLLWFGTSHYGVWTLDLETGIFQKLASRSLDEDRVGSIVVDDRGFALVGTTAGLTVYSAEGEFRKMYQWSRYDPSSIPTGTIYAQMSDRQGNLWFGTSRGGLSIARNSKEFGRVDSSQEDSGSLTKQKVTAILVDSKDRLWAGYHNEGLDLLDFESGTKTFFDPHDLEPGALGRGTVWDISETSDGSFWVGTNRSGLSWLKPGADRFEQFVPDENDPDSIGGYDVRAILPDADENLWIILHGTGIDYFDRSSSTFHHFDNLGRKWAEDMRLDRDGNLWVASTDGLSYLEKGSDTFVDYSYSSSDVRSLPDGHVVCLHLDTRDWLWVGTRNGLCVWRPGEDGFERFGMDTGLPSMAIRSVSESLSGEIWVATSGGLARFDPSNRSFKAFYKGDGLLSNEFTERSSFLARDGSLLIGGEKGIVRFHPERIRINEVPPDLLITGLSLFNDPLYPSNEDGAILKTSPFVGGEVVFPPGKSTFGFQFASLDFLSGKRKEYEFMLEGFDEKWIRSGRRSDCSYTNIPPGNYVFRVRSSNSDGVWNEEGVGLQVVVLPYFWQTKWFVAVVVLGLALLFFVVLKFRTASLARQKLVLLDTVSDRTKDLQDALYELELQKAQIEDQNLELVDHRERLEELIEQRTAELVEAKEMAEESDRLKSAFLENISHEIRTPMNAILGFANILKAGGSSEEEQDEYLGIIEENGEYLTALIDDLIEVSILESEKAVLNPEPVELHAYFSKWFCYLDTQLKRGGKQSVKSNLKFEGNRETKISVDFDSNRLDQILKNLIDNAVKFTDEGAIEILYGLNGQELVCEISDSGIGIPSNKLSDVFDLFRKLAGEKKRLYRGTGLGLAIVKRVSELLGGDVSVESVQGQGTRFLLKIPVGADERSDYAI